jgi:tripeptide aminopeptidase
MPVSASARKRRTAKTSNSRVEIKADSAVPFEPDSKRALDLVLRLMPIPGKSGQEGGVVSFIREQLLAAGLPGEAIAVDDANRRSPAGGETGNLIVKLPGTIAGPRRLLMAHMDTVPICVGSQPVLVDEDYESANPDSGLGADNRSGVAVVLTTALEIIERKLPHPPLTFFWPVQEEIGMFGSRYVDRSLLGKPRLAFNWDAYGAHRITRAATGSMAINVKIHGLAAHAGGSPEAGVSAIAIAGLAIHEIVTKGWHGDIHRGKRHGTSNIGIIKGGDATNVVTDLVELQAEARSHNRRFREQIARSITQAFERAATKVRNDDNLCGKVEIRSELEFDSFALKPTEPAVKVAWEAIRSIGMEPELIEINSGLDANWMNTHGIPTVTLGAGQARVHTKRECLDPEQYERACRIALRLATANPQ